MSLADRIIHSLKRIDQPSEFQRYRDVLKASSKLPPHEWSNLCRLVRSTRIYNILRTDLSKKEAEMLGNALRAASLNHVDDIIEVIMKKRDNNTPILLKYILEKKKKINIKPIQQYICEELKSEMALKHLQLLHVMYMNYPTSINSTIIDFCCSTDHPICKEISQSRMDIVE